MNSIKLAPLIVAGLLSWATPTQAHMTEECLVSIVKMDLSIAAVNRLYSAWMTGHLSGWTPQQLNKLKAQLDVAKAKKEAALPNLALCCAPGRSRPMPGCDGTLDPKYDQYDQYDLDTE